MPKTEKEKQWQRHMDEFLKTAKGGADVFLVRQNDLTLFRGVQKREPLAMLIADVINRFLTMLSQPDQWIKDGPMCLTCDHIFSHGEDPPVILINLPFAADWLTKPIPAVCNAICDRCADLDDTTILHKAAKVWGAQPLQAGHA